MVTMLWQGVSAAAAAAAIISMHACASAAWDSATRPRDASTVYACCVWVSAGSEGEGRDWEHRGCGNECACAGDRRMAKRCKHRACLLVGVSINGEAAER